MRPPERAPRLQAGVTERPPSAVAASIHAGVTVMGPGVPDANMHEGVTASVPTTAALNVHKVVHDAFNPIRKVFVVGVPHTNTPRACKDAASTIPGQPPIVKLAVPATKVRGAPTERALVMLIVR